MIKQFLTEDSGAETVEYGLVLALIAIAVIVAIQPFAAGVTFDSAFSRLLTCLSLVSCA